MPHAELDSALRTASNDKVTPVTASVSLAESWQKTLIDAVPGREAVWSQLISAPAAVTAVAQQIHDVKHNAHINSPPSAIRTGGRSVSLNDTNRDEDELLKYLVLDAYVKRKKDEGDNFDFKTFRQSFLSPTGIKHQINVALQKLNPDMRLKSTAIEKTLDYLEQIEFEAAQQLQLLKDQQDPMKPNSLAARIGFPTEPSVADSGSGALLACERQIKLTKARIDHLQVITPKLEADIKEHETHKPKAAGDQAFTAEGYSKWDRRRQELTNRLKSRQEELRILQPQSQQLEQHRQTLTRQKQELQDLKNPTQLDALTKNINVTIAQVEQLTSTKASSRATAAHDIVNPTANADIADPRLPMLGDKDDLKTFDYHLYERITDVNHDLEAMKDLAAALKANPNSPSLQKEYDDLFSQLKENLNKLLDQLNKYHLQGKYLSGAYDFSLVLQRRKNYKEFHARLVELVKTVQPWTRSVPVSVASEKEFKQATAEKNIFVYGRSGKLEAYTDQNGKPLKISDQAFAKAMQQFIAQGNAVTFDKPLAARLWGFIQEKLGKTDTTTTVYQFASPEAKQAFLSMAMREAMKEETEKRKEEQHQAADAAGVHAEPGDQTKEETDDSAAHAIDAADTDSTRTDSLMSSPS
jgi:septum formation inhibitor MinC